jgi:hypothetical protein
VQIPSSAKLVRGDTATNNFSDQEYVTKAFAQTLVGGSLTAGDGSVAQVENDGVFSVENSAGN